LLRMHPDSASLGFAVPLWWYGKVYRRLQNSK
jgi:hypothetical protein